MENKKKVFELIITDENIDGVQTISFVEQPAIEENFMFFSKDEKVEYKFEQQGDKYLVSGPAMIPNQMIKRRTPDEEFEVFFSEDTIEKCMEKFFKSNNHTSTNVNHNFKMIDGVTVIESWLVANPKVDKSFELFGKEYPKGTWMVTYKIDNQELWNKIKLGDVKGFSIEGFFIHSLTTMSNEESQYDSLKTLLLESNDTDDVLFQKIIEILNKN